MSLLFLKDSTCQQKRASEWLFPCFYPIEGTKSRCASSFHLTPFTSQNVTRWMHVSRSRKLHVGEEYPRRTKTNERIFPCLTLLCTTGTRDISSALCRVLRFIDQDRGKTWKRVTEGISTCDFIRCKPRHRWFPTTNLCLQGMGFIVWDGCRIMRNAHLSSGLSSA